jgi:hypothetical protein
MFSSQFPYFISPMSALKISTPVTMYKDNFEAWDPELEQLDHSIEDWRMEKVLVPFSSSNKRISLSLSHFWH